MLGSANRASSRQMPFSTVRNIVRNASRPGYLPVLVDKLCLRLRARRANSPDPEIIRWCHEHVEDAATFAESLDAVLWQEAQRFAEDFEEKARQRLAAFDVTLGGGGHIGLLYFLVRLKKPRSVVETGVAAGFSTQAMLAAMHRNGSGRLYSSDFPYFRLETPERYIGCLVDDDLKANWELFVRGDTANFPLILAKAGPVDLLHYDSDKSYEGRRRVIDSVAPQLSEGAVLVMDDIQDNAFFRDYTQATSLPFHVVEYQGKYLGLTGL